jgi:hypothetical protein
MGVAPLAVAVGLALAQYAAVTLHTVEVPYFLDRPLRHAEIREAMLRTLDAGASADAPDARELHWRYDQNVALSGFPPNEALALVWQGFPGVVFDLDTYEDAGRDAGGGPAGFEDLYFLAAVDAYNRRCGWHRYQRPLPRDEVEANADFVLLYEEGEGDGAGPADGRFPHHARVATLERPPGRIHVLRSARRTVPYRTLHARRFLARGETRREERRVVARELLMAATLAGDRAAARELIDEFPELRAPGDVRNIYWIGGYLALQRLAERRLAEWGL